MTLKTAPPERRQRLTHAKKFNVKTLAINKKVQAPRGVVLAWIVPQLVQELFDGLCSDLSSFKVPIDEM